MCCQHWRPSMSEHRLDERTQPPMADSQNSRWHGNEDDVGKTSNDEKKVSWGAAVVVEIVDRDNAGSPGCNEEHYESENHLEKHTKQRNREGKIWWIMFTLILKKTSKTNDIIVRPLLIKHFNPPIHFSSTWWICLQYATLYNHNALITLLFLTLAARLSAGTRFMTGASCAELRILLWV